MVRPRFSTCIAFAVFFVACFAIVTMAETPAAPPAGKPFDIFPIDQVKPGMKAIGYTVFEGTQPEPFPVEIIGVMKNVWGPRQHIILARLGDKVTATGVAGGMSGSPVYLDGKLLGAVSLRIGVFSREPIAGITPAGLMLEIKEIDKSAGPGMIVASQQQQKIPLPGDLGATLGTQAGISAPEVFLTPIETPLVFSGFHDAVLRQFADVFRQMGVTPVQGGASGNVQSIKPPSDPEVLKRALPPGAAVSGVLVTGDLSVAGTGTVTYNDGHRVLAFGHPFFNFGPIEMPMARSEVLTVLGSSYAPFKIANVSDVVGSLRQDRHSGILGVLGESSAMIPVKVTVRSGKEREVYSYQVFQNPKFTPFMVMLTCFNTLFGTNQYGDEATYRMRGAIQMDGLPEVRLENMFASADVPGGQPGPMALSFWIGERFARIYNNAYEAPRIQGVNFDFDVIPERRTATIEQVWLEKNEARPGDTIDAKVFLRPYRGERIVKDVQVTIPAAAPKGDLRIVFSDADLVNRPSNMMLAANRVPGLNQIISMLNREHANGRIYVTLLQSAPTVLYEDKVMPSVPSSVVNVIEPNRYGKLTIWGESAMQQDSIPVDYVIAGNQTAVVTVK